MSPRWRDERRVALAPAAAKWARWTRGWARAPVESACVPAAAGGGGPAWRAPLEALRAAWSAEADGPARSAAVRVILSNHFVRYVVVPWRAELRGRAERQALAEHAFLSTYGEPAAAWHVRLAPSRYGAAALACAVDRELAAALAALCEAGHHRLAGVQPLLMSAFNQHRHEFGAAACLFVLEPGRLCCAWWQDGNWQAVRSVRLTGPAGAALLERERRLLGVPDDAPSFVCDVGHGLTPADGEATHRCLAPPMGWRADASLALFAAAA